MEELPTADLITQEVDTLKSMIGAYKDRMVLLEDLQSTVNSGHNVTFSETHARVLREKWPLLSDIAEDEDTVPSSSADDYLISKTIISQDEEVSHITFLPLRNPRSSGSQSSSASQTAMPSSLLVAVQIDGYCRLFTPQGELVLTFESGHEHPVTILAVSPSHDEYFITSADAGGVVRVHKVNVRQRRLTKEQKQARRGSTDEKVSQYLGSQVNVTAQFTKQFQVPAGSNGEPPRLTALAVASQQGSKYFVVGDADGQVSVFTRNGTFRAKVDIGTPPGGQGIEGLHAHVGSLLFHAGGDWGFINLDKLEVQRMECPQFDGRATAAIVDSQQTSRVLVADENGTIWVFNVKDRKNCKVEHRFPKGATHAPVDLGSIRGFTVVLERAQPGTGARELLALNMSHVGKKRDSLSSASPVVWRTPRAPVRGWAAHKRYQQGDLLAFLSEDGREIEVAELLMQVYQPPKEDAFSNFKMPVIAVAVVLVLGYQWMKQKGGKYGGGGGGGGKKHDWDSHDFSALRNRKKGLGGMGGGLGGGLGGLKGAGGLGRR